MEVEFRKHLPPYRSLVDPNAQYDYRTHLFVHLSQLDLSKILLGYQLPQIRRSSFKMKYKLLLSDVSMRASLLLRKVPSVNGKVSTPNSPARAQLARKLPSPPPATFNDLPEEIQIRIFDFVNDKASYQNCLFTSKAFYRMAKPFLFQNVSFTSTYRFAQFITYLRVNSALGLHVLEVDLSQLRPGNWELEAQSDDDQDLDTDQDEFSDISAIWAGWRDWKFANNPLYTLHPLPATPLTKVTLVTSPGAFPPSKKRKFLSYFKKRRRSTVRPELPDGRKPPHQRHVSWALQNSSHPKINKFLMNYSSLKDLLIGYIVHLVNLCPNLRSVNFGNLSLSTDYMISPKMSQKYQNFDIMNNFSKAMIEKIDGLYPMSNSDLGLLTGEPTIRRAHDLASSASSVFSMSTMSKPIRKYNSLLPPLPKLVRDILYLSKGDGIVFLSDLNLKSINSAHLEAISEAEILDCMRKRAGTLQNINLCSMIWINLRLVKQFIWDLLADDIEQKRIDGKDYFLFKNNYFSPLEPLDDEDDDEDMDEAKFKQSKSLVLDLSNSGMSRNLRWAQRIDLETTKGKKLVHKILNDELLSVFEERMFRERMRMGRPGENYFA